MSAYMVCPNPACSKVLRITTARLMGGVVRRRYICDPCNKWYMSKEQMVPYNTKLDEVKASAPPGPRRVAAVPKPPKVKEMKMGDIKRNAAARHILEDRGYFKVDDYD